MYKSDLKEAGGELDSNFIQFVKVCPDQKPNLTKWMEKYLDKFMSSSI